MHPSLVRFRSFKFENGPLPLLARNPRTACDPGTPLAIER